MVAAKKKCVKGAFSFATWHVRFAIEKAPISNRTGTNYLTREGCTNWSDEHNLRANPMLSSYVNLLQFDNPLTDVL